MSNIPSPDFMFPIVDSDGVALEEFQRWISQVTNMDLIIGAGSPEGIIDAIVGREYMDETGATGSIKYIKQFADIGGNRSMGWVLL